MIYKKLKNNLNIKFRKKRLNIFWIGIIIFLACILLWEYKNYINFSYSYCYQKADQDIRQFWRMQNTYSTWKERDGLLRPKQNICRENLMAYLLWNKDKNLFEKETKELLDYQYLQKQFDENQRKPLVRKDYSRYVDTLVDIPIRNGWNLYNKIFAENRFKFLYPSQFIIYDDDPYSGSIQLTTSESTNNNVHVDRAPHSYSQHVYSGGDPIEWLFEAESSSLEKEKYEYVDIDYETHTFKNGKKYYRILKWAGGSEPKYDYFFGIQNGIPVELTDQSTLSQEEILFFLQNLNIY